ncbi:MAG TPA: F0F1 ATP synthase subunit delta [Gammaproteobacteria bacterium]|nr:F0F1 ATP synthase subunit delta [Gammaproteobacteria bacterium]
MAQEATTIARPYAEAVFALANESSTLDQWSEMLEFIASLMQDSTIQRLVNEPGQVKSQISELIIDIGGGKLTQEEQNLVRLLAENGRLDIVSEIAQRYESMKDEERGVLDVDVTTAFPLDEAQQQSIATVLKNKLGRDIRITSSEDPALIGGVLIHAGDLVIDSSVQGQLNKLANELEH